MPWLGYCRILGLFTITCPFFMVNPGPATWNMGEEHPAPRGRLGFPAQKSLRAWVQPSRNACCLHVSQAQSFTVGKVRETSLRPLQEEKWLRQRKPGPFQKEMSPISAGAEKSSFPWVMSSAIQLNGTKLRTKDFVQPKLVLGPPASPYVSCNQKPYLSHTGVAHSRPLLE